MAKKKRRQVDSSLSKGMTSLLLVVVVVVFGFILWAVFGHSKPKGVEPEYTPKSSKRVSVPKAIKESSSSTSSSSDSEDENALNDIVAGAQGRVDKYLEKKNEPITDSVQTEAIATYIAGVVDLIQHNADAKAPHDYNLDDSMGLAMVGTFKTAINAGYTIDQESFKAYESKHSNVIQYTFTMSREGSSTVAFIGNYLSNLGRGTVTRMEGNLGNVAFD